MKSLIVLAFVTLALMAISVSALSRRTTAEGRIMCQIDGMYFPIKMATVFLKDEDVVFNDVFGETRSNDDGRFRVSGTAGDTYGNPDPYIKVRYQYTGTYGSMEVNGLLKTVRSYRTPKRSYQSYINFDDIVISDDHCRAYVLFYEAMADYYNRTGSALPIKPMHVRTHAIIQVGHPYAETKTVNIPKGFPLNMTTAMLTLAHLVRHSLDGSYLHLLGDALRYGYRGPHSCNAKTNEGRAFDEGWGEFWAGLCMQNYYGNSPYNYTYEGNVASSLRRLKFRCDFSYQDMIDVLRRNAGAIHSYGEYEAASGCPRFPMFPKPTTPKTGTTMGTKPIPVNRLLGVTGYLQKLLHMDELKNSKEEAKAEMLDNLLKELVDNE